MSYQGGGEDVEGRQSTAQHRKVRDQRVRMLYEEYIGLDPLLATWGEPVTESPRIEPQFVAGMQAVEVAFLVLASFVSDARAYVVKRPRVEMVADDIQQQWRLLAEVVDGELEDENVSHGTLSTLTQSFPFPGAPPIAEGAGAARQSPGLALLIRALAGAFPNEPEGMRNSLRKMVRNLTGTFQRCFSEWTVGVGIEEQLSQLRALVGLRPLEAAFGRQYLAYEQIVRPEVVARTFVGKEYAHDEDFFFRSVHLGTECWCFVVLQRLSQAREQVERYNHWHNAAAHVRVAAAVLDYLGRHVMMLTSMVLRDYLRLKVEIEGTSGAGSANVKALRPTAEGMFALLAAAVSPPPAAAPADGDALAGGDAPADGDVPAGSNSPAVAQDQAQLQARLLELYQHPERSPGWYNFAKSLETCESALVGGFFYHHFMLATNVIGSAAKGTMKMSVQALKKTYERAVFPQLDQVRSELGRITDEGLGHLKGRMMDNIEHEYHLRRHGSTDASAALAISAEPAMGASGCPFASGGATVAGAAAAATSSAVTAVAAAAAAAAAAAVNSAAIAGSARGLTAHLSAGPGSSSSGSSSSSSSLRGRSPSAGTAASDAGDESPFELLRASLYSSAKVPEVFHEAARAEAALQAQRTGATGGRAVVASFLDHAWGHTPPAAHVAAAKRQFGLYQQGNSTWDVLFGEVAPEAAGHVKRLLGLAEVGGATVQFGHNSHEIVTRLLSMPLERVLTREQSALRVLTTDTEFYSLTRQLNRLAEAGPAVQVQVVPIEPLDSFEERFVQRAAQSAFDFCYVSQCVFLSQQTLVARPVPFAVRLHAALEAALVAAGEVAQEGESAGAAPGSRARPRHAPLVVIDGYHSFGAIPTSLAGLPATCFFVSGVLKHVGAGANCAFLVIPPGGERLLKPLLTGWLADPSVLSADSTGVAMGQRVGYGEGFSLLGGTPAFLPSLLIFVEVMRLWLERGVTVDAVHEHVMALHRRFLQGLEARLATVAPEAAPLSPATLCRPLQPEAARSHTLVFRQVSPARSSRVVEYLRAAHGIEVDARKGFLRVGFGFNHSFADVDRLLDALVALSRARLVTS